VLENHPQIVETMLEKVPCNRKEQPAVCRPRYFIVNDDGIMLEAPA
jgi:hypothetical protein